MIDQHTLFLDNYRGFNNTFIPLLDVNFLVGENSTGKTSVLSLLKLMSGDKLLVENAFTDDDVSLGAFRDIASAHAKNTSSFRIGMIRRDIGPKGITPMGVLVNYEKHEGLPRDSFVTCTFLNKEVSVRRQGNDIYYRVRAGVIDSSTKIHKLFPQWIEDQQRSNGGFTKLNFTMEKASLLFALSAVAQDVASPQLYRFPTLNPLLFPPLAWVAPVRTKPLRTYDEPRSTFSSVGSHTPYLIRKVFSSTEAKKLSDSINRFGKESGLFDSLDIKHFGEDDEAPFEVRVVLDGKPFNVANVGYGVSQALPVLVEMLSRSPGSWFAVQQLEVHIHPRAQAAFGDLIFAMARLEEKRFLIETHSDFTIDRFRSNFRKSAAQKPSGQVLFFERRNGFNTVTALPISDSGDMPAKQPKSYRDFFLKETVRVLDL